MLLLQGEQIVASESVDRVRGGEQLAGMLFLTNYRIVFEQVTSRGLLRSARTRTALDAAVDQVSNATVDRRLFGVGRPMLNVEVAGVGTFTFKTNAAQDWAARIASVRSQVRPRHLQAAQQGSPVVVNVHAAAAPGPQAFLHCRYCGALTPAGATAGPAKCGACGAAL